MACASSCGAKPHHRRCHREWSLCCATINAFGLAPVLTRQQRLTADTRVHCCVAMMMVTMITSFLTVCMKK